MLMLSCLFVLTYETCERKQTIRAVYHVNVCISQIKSSILQCLPPGPPFEEVLLLDYERMFDVAPPVAFFIT